MTPETLWAAIRITARLRTPDPRAAEILAQGIPLTCLPMAVWALHQCPDQAPELFAMVGYDLNLFSEAGTPEALATALAAVPSLAGGSLTHLARTTAWQVVSQRGAPWFSVLAQWADTSFSEPRTSVQFSPQEREVMSSVLAQMRGLLSAPAGSFGASSGQEAMQLLVSLASSPRWAKLLGTHSRVAELHRGRDSGDTRAVRYHSWFEPGHSWAPGVPPREGEVLQHPVQVLVHDQIWGTQYFSAALAMRGMRWIRTAGNRDGALLISAIARLTGHPPRALPQEMQQQNFLAALGDFSPTALAPLLKSPEASRREFGIKLMVTARRRPVAGRPAP